MNIPDTTAKLKQCISRYKSSFKKEKREYGYVNDGAGKRYLLFCFYFLLGDLKKAEDYIEWYQSEFPDDSGEPIQLFCWAIIMHQSKKEAQAKAKLAESMLANLYILPKVIGCEVKKYSMWHSSNYCESDYIEHMPVQIIRKLSESDIVWITTL